METCFPSSKERERESTAEQGWAPWAASEYYCLDRDLCRECLLARDCLGKHNATS